MALEKLLEFITVDILKITPSGEFTDESLLQRSELSGMKTNLSSDSRMSKNIDLSELVTIPRIKAKNEDDSLNVCFRITTPSEKCFLGGLCDGIQGRFRIKKILFCPRFGSNLQLFG